MLVSDGRGRIPERKHIPVRILLVTPYYIVLFVEVFTCGHIEKLNEKPDETISSLPFDFYRTVKPSPVRFGYIRVFVCEVRTAHKPDSTVDYRYFPVVAVIVTDRYYRYELVEFSRVDSVFHKQSVKIRRYFRHTADVIVHDVRFHALRDFLL